MGYSSFIASSRWLDQWKKRHGVRHLSICRDTLSADTASAEEYIHECFEIVSWQNYSAQQIYNADETRLKLFLDEALPMKSLATHEESLAPGFKMNKHQLTADRWQQYSAAPGVLLITPVTARHLPPCMSLEVPNSVSGLG